MHELAIAESVARIAIAHAAGRSVEVVNLRVGHLRQVVPSALEFSFELVARATELDGAELRIEEIPAAGRCRACGEETIFDEFPFACATCSGRELELIRGEELEVESLDLAASSAAPAGP